MADVSEVMTHLISHARRSRTKFPPEYARSARMDDLLDGFGPRGGSGGGGAPALQAWQLPPAKVLRHYLVCGQLKPRMCYPVR